MKALEKDRSRRYETASGLAMDIAATWTAKPCSRRRRARPIACGSSSDATRAPLRRPLAIAAALLVGVIGFAWQADVAQGERDAARLAQKAEEERAAARAESNESKADGDQPVPARHARLGRHARPGARSQGLPGARQGGPLRVGTAFKDRPGGRGRRARDPRQDLPLARAARSGRAAGRRVQSSSPDSPRGGLGRIRALSRQPRLPSSAGAAGPTPRSSSPARRSRSPGTRRARRTPSHSTSSPTTPTRSCC